MFRTLDAPRFQVHDVVVRATQCFLTWDFTFRTRAPAQPNMAIRGGSHLKLAMPTAASQSHRDYWDAAEELYEKLPVLGT
jgi:steroid delta-isomerase